MSANNYAVVVGAALEISLACARVAALLLKKERASNTAIDTALGLSEGGARVYIGRLRKALTPHGVKVYCDAGSYYLDQKDRKRLSDKVAKFSW